MTPTTPGRRFRAARKAAGLTQVEAAQRIGTGLGQTDISAYETGRRKIGLERLYGWCSACGIDPSSVDPRLARLPACR